MNLVQSWFKSDCNKR